MSNQTHADMIAAGASPTEATAAAEMFRVLRPGLKVKRSNGRIETTHGDKNPLGLYRTVKDIVRSEELTDTPPATHAGGYTPATTGHTPGPWQLQAGRSIVTSSGEFYLSYGSDRHGNPKFKDFCELDSNARLIAAAPDLLSSLQALFKECAMIHRYGGEACNQKAADAAILAARQAIAAATGDPADQPDPRPGGTEPCRS